MLWEAGPTSADCDEEADANSALPPWKAVIVQVPVVSGMTVRLDTVHTVGESEPNTTERPDEAVAHRVNGTPKVAPGRRSKRMLCSAFPSKT